MRTLTVMVALGFFVAVSASCTSGSPDRSSDEGGEGGSGDGGGGAGGDGAGGQGGNGDDGMAGAAAGSGGSADNAGGSAGASNGGSGGMPPAGGAGGDDGNNNANLMACSKITATVRDFVSTHPDFEFSSNCDMNPDECPGSGLGMVRDELDANKHPRLVGNSFTDDMGFKQVDSAQSFAQWWTDVDGINHSFETTLELVERSAALKAFGGEEFFPIDDKGFGNKDYTGGDTAKDDMVAMEDMLHNHLITLEAHAEFLYEAGKGQIIITESDDDSWVFINNKLAIDNGGLHGFAPASGTLDPLAAELGLEDGKRYPISFFFADRQMTGSAYRVSTNVKFTHCNN